MSALAVADSPTHQTAVPHQLHLRAPLPGLPGHETFTLDALDDEGALFAMRSAPAGRAPVRLFVVPPRLFFPDYAPRVDPEATALVGGHPAEHLLLVVVHPGDGGSPHTANLLAPLVVDPNTGAAVQTVLNDDWPLHAPLG